jgi:muramidase (phage lysozyme)
MSPNLSAFLAVLRACEGTAGPYGYRTLFGGAMFDGYDDHPRISVTASGYTSTAAGAYQILAGSWDDYRAKTSAGKSFDPAAQDAYAVWAIRDKRKALADVEAGRLEEAIAKCNKEWASLPGSPYGQPTRTMDYCRRVYRDAGGMPEGVGTHKPPVDKPTVDAARQKANMDPLTLSLVGSLISMFAPKLGVQVGKVISSPEGQPLLNTILSIAKTETGQASDKAALVMAAESPAVVAKIESAADDWLDKMAPALDRIAALEAADFAATEKSKDAAQARWVGQDFDPAPMLTYFSLATVGLLTLFLCAWISIQLLYEKGVGVEMWAALTGMIGWITAKAGSIYDNRFGTTRQSAAKDVVISEMAARR